MKIYEILLPKGVSDRSLSPQKLRKIDAIQQRMDKYVDAIYSPNTSPAGKEFLKLRLRDEVAELKNTLGSVHKVAEDNVPVQYEVYDKKTGLRVPGRGPYADRNRARRVVDKLDNEYGAYRYGHRPVQALKEAVHKVPLTPKDFEAVKVLFEKPIPAGIAAIYVQDLIEDDELFEQFDSIDAENPGQDVRPLIVEWINRVMPDKMHYFVSGRLPTKAQQDGILSPIHGYDSHMYKGTNDPITGDAYGSY